MDAETLETIRQWSEMGRRCGPLNTLDLIREIDRLRALAEWRPIETAPKDGTAVLVRCTHGVYAVCFKEGPTGYVGWHVDDNKHGPFMLRGDSPTSWLPLPEPPKGT